MFRVGIVLSWLYNYFQTICAMYTQFVPQPFTCRPRQGLSFISPPPSGVLNVRIPWGTPVGYPRAPTPQFPKMGNLHANEYHQVYNEQSQQGGIPNNKGLPNLANSHIEIKALHQQLIQALEQQAVKDSEINRLNNLVQKQQGELDSVTQSFEKREIELKREQEQINIKRQRDWEQGRKRELAEWVERQRAWKEREQTLNEQLAKRQSEWGNEQYLKQEGTQGGASNSDHDQDSQRSRSEDSFVISRRHGNKAVPGNNMREYTHGNAYQHQRRNYYHGKKRAHYENNGQGNAVPNTGPRIPNNSEQPTRPMEYVDQAQNNRWNNQGRYPNPRGRPPYLRNRGDNLGGVNNCNQYIPAREPKLSKYDGSIPWRVYEVKLLHLAQRYQWDDDIKLAKLVEALEDRALIFFSNLPSNIQVNFEAVRKKMNNRFIPQEPAITVRKQLQTIRQNVDEAL